MNALSILMLYNRVVDDPNYTFQPRTFLFGAKASPGYYRAKLIIRLINAIAQLVEKHPRARKLIKVVFMENYCVSLAEALMPAAEVSEQLSTAGKEASGTGNMKFMMTAPSPSARWTGPHEISKRRPRKTLHFGLTAEEVEKGYSSYRASEVYETNPAIRRAMEQLIDGTLCPENPRLFQDLYHALLFGDGGGMADPYFVLKDLPGYVRAQAQVGADYQNRSRWLERAIMNTASSGYFCQRPHLAEYNERCGICPNCLYRERICYFTIPAICNTAHRRGAVPLRERGHAARAFQHCRRARAVAHLVGGQRRRIRNAPHRTRPFRNRARHSRAARTNVVLFH